MLLTISRLNKGSFLGSLINKCRQVVRIKSVKHLETNLKTNISNSTTLKHAAATTNLIDTENRPISSSSPVVASSKTLEEKLGIPPRPKKPLTPYFRFMKEIRPTIRAANPSLSLTDIVKAVSKKWEAADVSLKQRLGEEYKVEQNQYIEKRTKYDAKITDEQRAQIKELKQEISDAKQRRMLRKRIKELGRPKKPASAFLRYLAKERTQTPQTPKQTFREWHELCTARWKALTQAEKDIYILDARKELDKYKVAISLWEEKMIRLGHIDVVRHVNLIDPPQPKPRKH